MPNTRGNIVQNVKSIPPHRTALQSEFNAAQTKELLGGKGEILEDMTEYRAAGVRTRSCGVATTDLLITRSPYQSLKRNGNSTTRQWSRSDNFSMPIRWGVMILSLEPHCPTASPNSSKFQIPRKMVSVQFQHGRTTLGRAQLQ